MRTHQREILVYYNPESSNDKKTVAYAQTLTRHVKVYSFKQAPSTGYSWQQILNALDVPVKDILNKANPYYQEHLRGCDFDDECWIKILQKNPELIKAPIAVRGKRAVLCQTPTDILQLIEIAEVAK